MVLGSTMLERSHHPLKVCESVESLKCSSGPSTRGHVFIASPCGLVVTAVITFQVRLRVEMAIVFWPSWLGPFKILVIGLAALNPPRISLATTLYEYDAVPVAKVVITASGTVSV